MALDRSEIEKLHVEAKRIRRNFRYIHDDLKKQPENIDLLRQRDHLKKRYSEITAILAEAREPEKSISSELADSTSQAPTVDMSIFEPKPFEVPAAVAIKQRGGTPGTGARITLNDIRKVLAVSALIVVLPFFYLRFVKDLSFFEVPSKSMEPTLLVGDRILSVAPGAYKRGDIVVLPDPQNPGDFLVKRLVAFGGDTIEVTNKTLFVNSQPITEKYLKESPQYTIPPTKVPDGEVYLLGDNRNESDDSHIWGTGRPLADLKGRVLYIYAPSTRRRNLPDQTPAFGDVKAPQ